MARGPPWDASSDSGGGGGLPEEAMTEPPYCILTYSIVTATLWYPALHLQGPFLFWNLQRLHQVSYLLFTKGQVFWAVMLGCFLRLVLQRYLRPFKPARLQPGRIGVGSPKRGSSSSHFTTLQNLPPGLACTPPQPMQCFSCKPGLTKFGSICGRRKNSFPDRLHEQEASKHNWHETGPQIHVCLHIPASSVNSPNKTTSYDFI